jgi:hypothetical protein
MPPKNTANAAHLGSTWTDEGFEGVELQFQLCMELEPHSWQAASQA